MSPVFSDGLQAIAMAVMFGTGARMVVRPRDFRGQGIKNNERAIAERLARGHDRYFEELRTLKAYAEPRPTRTVRMFGAAMMILPALVLILYFVR